MPQHRTHKIASKKADGFTLIETLVVVIIMGLLSAIALPFFLRQVNKAKETEAQLAVSSLKKNQYFFYLENNSFSQDLQALGLVESETDNYKYTVQAHERLNGRLHLAVSKKKELQSYGSVVHFKEGQLTECSLFAIEMSLEHPHLELLGFIMNAIENPEQFCS